MKVDVVILTKNSASTLLHTILGILNSVPVNNLIIVDGGSTDKTIDIADEFGAKIITCSSGIGVSRYKGALEAKTEWICFVDSDIYVFPSWFKQLKRWMKLERVVWIQGLTLEHSRIFASYALSKTLTYARRGCIALSNALIKKDIVLECKDWIRNNVHAGEDAILYELVKSRGYRVLVDTTALCFHLPDCFFHDIYALYRAGRSDRLRRKHLPILYLGVPLLLLKEGFSRSILVNDLRLTAYFTVILGLSYMLGFSEIMKDKAEKILEKIDRLSRSTEVNQLITQEAEKWETKFKNIRHIINV